MSLESRQRIIEKLDAQLKEYNARISTWEAKASKAAVNAKHDIRDTLDQLHKRQAGMRSALGELRSAGDGAWEELKKGVDQAWEDLKSAVDHAAKKL